MLVRKSLPGEVPKLSSIFDRGMDELATRVFVHRMVMEYGGAYTAPKLIPNIFDIYSLCKSNFPAVFSIRE